MSRALGFKLVSDGTGGTKMVPRPIDEVSAKKGKKKKIQPPDPINENTNDESTAASQLRRFIERVERLEEEKAGISDDIRDVYSEAKSQGYDSKIMRQIVKLRKMEPHDRLEMEAILETYKTTLGLA